MTSGFTAHERHRAQAIMVALLLGGCAPAVPLPPAAPVDAGDYQPVSSSPRPAPVEFLPQRPRKDAVWVDGSWEWSGERFAWRAGTWTVPPKGLRRARWVIVRRKEDGQLFFAPALWKDQTGKTVDDAAWLHALGPQARARTRIGGPAAAEEIPARRAPARPARTPSVQAEKPNEGEPEDQDLR